MKITIVLGFVASLLAGVLQAAAPQRGNISDEEVAEIVAAIGSESTANIISIGSTAVGCPCGEGPDCTESVTVLVSRNGQVDRVRLSKIASHWSIGPLMRRQLELVTAKAVIRAERPSKENRRKLAQLHFEERRIAIAMAPCRAP